MLFNKQNVKKYVKNRILNLNFFQTEENKSEKCITSGVEEMSLKSRKIAIMNECHLKCSRETEEKKFKKKMHDRKTSILRLCNDQINKLGFLMKV